MPPIGGFLPCMSTVSVANGVLTANGPLRLNSVTAVSCCADSAKGSISKLHKVVFLMFISFIFWVFYNWRIGLK